AMRNRLQESFGRRVVERKSSRSTLTVALADRSDRLAPGATRRLLSSAVSSWTGSGSSPRRSAGHPHDGELEISGAPFRNTRFGRSIGLEPSPVTSLRGVGNQHPIRPGGSARTTMWHRGEPNDL